VPPQRRHRYPWTVNRQHHYRIVNRWTGNLGTGTSAYAAYSRAHELSGTAKSAAIAGSSDALFRGDATRYNPEELLLGALSACHMLWVLHLSADAGITVTAYEDEPWGEVTEHADGSGEFTRVVLRPRVTIAETDRIGDVLAIHQRANAVCTLARSMNFPVDHEPRVNGQDIT
jgi:organic hydroperoxide reductase OsmC/OhrA